MLLKAPVITPSIVAITLGLGGDTNISVGITSGDT